MNSYYTNELVHYGVKGMKWGVRKKYYNSSMDNDRVIKKGTSVQNISRDKPRELRDNTPVYGAHTTKDKANYAGKYADTLMFFDYKPYKNDIQITKDIKIPSQKKAVETFVEMYKKDPQGMARSIGKAYAEVVAFNKISFIRDKRADYISKKFSKKGEEWLANKGYLIFNQSMMAPEETKARNEYYGLLRKKGYDGLLDINDIQTGYDSEDPIIYINPKETMKNVKSIPMTIDDIEIAKARYNYEVQRANRKKH